MSFLAQQWHVRAPGVVATGTEVRQRTRKESVHALAAQSTRGVGVPFDLLQFLFSLVDLINQSVIQISLRES